MTYEVGMLYDGKISRITAYGAFVTLEDGKLGMIHISEVSDGFVRDIREFLSEGQNVRVKLIRIDDTGKLALSLKQVPAESKRTAPPVEYEAKTEKSSSFEDMMSQFMSRSNDKMSDLKQRGDVQPKRRRRE